MTDRAGKWKTFTSDVQGNLTTVTEPDPANQPGGTLTTSYTYDWMNHLVGVSMPRGTAPQTRMFVYDDAGRLTSATNPENGTVSYYYNSDNTLNYKNDANGNQTTYTYDGQKRVTACRGMAMHASRSVIRMTRCHPDYGGYANSARVTEMYSYHPAGGVTIKRLHIYLPYNDPFSGNYDNADSDTEVDYSYTQWGEVASTTLPTSQANNGSDTCGYCGWHAVPITYSVGYAGAGRPASMTDNDPNAPYAFGGRVPA